MKLPFGLPVIKDLDATAQYEHKLAEYRDTLEKYKKYIIEHSSKLDSYDRRAMDNQLSIVQTALDLTYLKEQEDRIIELINNISQEAITNTTVGLENLTETMARTYEMIEGLDKNVVNRISELLIELQKQSTFQNKQSQTDLLVGLSNLERREKKGHAVIWFLFILNLLSLSGIAFLILYTMEMIPF